MIYISLHPLAHVQAELGMLAIREDESWLTTHSVFEQTENKCTKVVAARDAGERLVGYALITNRNPCSSKSDCLYHVCVAKKHRRQGICRSMVETALQECGSLWGVCDESVKKVWERLGAEIKPRMNDFEVQLQRKL